MLKNLFKSKQTKKEIEALEEYIMINMHNAEELMKEYMKTEAEARLYKAENNYVSYYGVNSWKEGTSEKTYNDMLFCAKALKTQMEALIAQSKEVREKINALKAV